MDWIRVLDVSVLAPLQLKVSFNDGLTGILDMVEYSGKGEFIAIEDFDFFKQVKIVEGGRAIEWPGNLDLCADSLHALVLTKKYSEQEISQNASD